MKPFNKEQSELMAKQIQAIVEDMEPLKLGKEVNMTKEQRNELTSRVTDLLICAYLTGYKQGEHDKGFR